MELRTLVALARSGRLGLIRATTSLITEHTRAGFLAAAAREGVLEHLAAGPSSLESLAGALDLPPESLPALEAWMEVGAALGEMKAGPVGWELRGKLARALAHEDNDDLSAMLEEITSLHHRLVHETPAMLRTGERLSLADQPGEVVARSSRMAEPLVQEAIREVVPRSGPLRVLEVGCGSGSYARYMVERNPQSEVHALELQGEVAAMARQNFRAWGMSHRVTVEEVDVRAYRTEVPFDLVTLHNNIYYFPDEARIPLLEHVRTLLVPGGRVLLTTACRRGSASGAVLHLWGLMTRGAGPLPVPTGVLAQLREAGYGQALARSLGGPFERFFSFTAANPLDG
jgi:4-hydroxy-2,2'-bipyrrole-5-carbaldehyde O-methyltransferase